MVIRLLENSQAVLLGPAQGPSCSRPEHFTMRSTEGWVTLEGEIFGHVSVRQTYSNRYHLNV
jgi:hypothetical protein